LKEAIFGDVDASHRNVESTFSKILSDDKKMESSEESSIPEPQGQRPASNRAVVGYDFGLAQWSG
jgi:hypothetical protein